MNSDKVFVIFGFIGIALVIKLLIIIIIYLVCRFIQKHQKLLFYFLKFLNDLWNIICQTLNQFWTKNKTNFTTNLIYCQK